jgi:hypothetical protein
MSMNVLHQRLLQDVLAVGNALPFETFYRPPVVTPYGPTLSMDDAIGCKVRALADRGVARDLIDVRAASHWRSTAELENLGRRLAREEFSLEGLATRLDGAKWFDDEEFVAYGLGEADIGDLREWAQAWCDEIRRRLYAENFDFDGDDDV